MAAVIKYYGRWHHRKTDANAEGDEAWGKEGIFHCDSTTRFYPS